MFRTLFRRMSGMVRHLRKRFQQPSGKPASNRKPAPKTSHVKPARSNGHRPTKRKKSPVRVVKKS